MQCPRCGADMSSPKRCGACGYAVGYAGNTEFYQRSVSQKLGLGDVFAEVFERHGKNDGERLFVAGTERTTPGEESMLSEWRKPWLFSRVLLWGGLVTFLFYIFNIYFGVRTDFGFVFIGAFFMPVTVLLFFWEMNIPRNIPLYDVMKMFVLGGVISLAVTGVLFRAVNVTYAPFAAFIEEPAKVAAVFWFLRKKPKSYVLNGLLIGAAVGAAFGAFESGSYGLDGLIGNAGLGVLPSLDNVVARALLAPGMHVAWAALEGGALALAAGGARVEASHLAKPDFLKIFAAALGLHFFWNMGLSILPLPYVVDLTYLLLMGAVWFFLLFVINKGTAQIVGAAGRPPSPAAAKEGARLLVMAVTGSYAGMEFPTSPVPLKIGRDPKQANLVLSDGAEGVSRLHCTIYCENGALWLRDEGSTCGTFTERSGRLAPGRAVRVGAGERFYLADRDRLFQVVAEQNR